MVASPRQRLILPLAPTGAGVFGVLTALMFAVMPSGALESLVVDSGVASLVNAAQPPLGFTARAVLALLGGGVVTGFAWVALFVAVGTRSVILQDPRRGDGGAAALRRADAHPDAPPRQPVFANRDLGTPFLEVRAEAVSALPAATIATAKQAPVERALPDDLDMPLAAFDPQSFAAPSAPLREPEPDVAVAPPEAAAAPLPIRLDTGRAIDLIAASMQAAPPPVPAWEDRAPPLHETIDAPAPIRLDTGRAIDLIAASMQQPAPRPPETPGALETDAPASIRALLDRLERSVARREAAPPPSTQRQERQDSIRDTLETLRGLATRTG